MNTTATASNANRSRIINLETCGAIALVLIAAASLAACGPATGDTQADAGISSTADSGTPSNADSSVTTSSTDTSPAKPDGGGNVDATTSHPAAGASSHGVLVPALHLLIRDAHLYARPSP